MYQFRMPASTPKLTAGGLDAYAGGRHETTIGTTVRIRRTPAGGFSFILYGLTLATIYPETVVFTVAADDPHNASGEWLNKIAVDNGFGGVFRDNWVRYMYGPYSRPIKGQTFEIRSGT